MANVILYINQRERVVLTGKTDGMTASAGPRGAADAMNVILGILRQVVVDHMAHAGDMQTTGSDVGRDQYLPAPFLEGFEQLLALFLRHVTRQHTGREALSVQRPPEPVTGAAHVGEDQHPFTAGLL